MNILIKIIKSFLFNLSKKKLRIDITEPIYDKIAIERSKIENYIAQLDLHTRPSIKTRRYIVIHHSLTHDGKAVNWNAIRKWHIEHNGWSDIGYHYGIELVDDKYIVQIGRPEHINGAHVKQGGFNLISLGICVVGNFDEYIPSDLQWYTTLILVRRLMRIYDIPVANIIGHREAQAMAKYPEHKRKSCPGMQFDMDKFRNSLIKLIVGVPADGLKS